MSNPEEQRNMGSVDGADSFLVSRSPWVTVSVLLLIFLMFAAIGFGLHLPGFHSPMVYDSSYFIQGKASLFAQHEVLKLISIVPARPLFLTTLYLNHLVTGMEPFYFRVGNILLLAGAGLALVLLAATIFGIQGLRVPGTRQEKLAVSILLGLLFVVHPLQSYVVLYVWQREAIMACFFYFAGLAVYLAARSGRFRHEIAAYACAALLFLAGMLSKENVVTFPAMLILAELVLFGQGLRGLIKRALPIAAIVVPVAVSYLLVTHYLHASTSEIGKGVFARIAEHYTYAGTSPVHVALTEARTLFSYLAMILVPYDLEFMRPEIVSKSILTPPTTLLACLGWISLLGMSIVLARKKPLIAFGILFYVVALLPESLLIPQYLFFSYRAILPMFGVLLVLGGAMLALNAWAAARLPERPLKVAMAGGSSVVLVLFAVVTYSQAKSWSPDSFWNNPSSRLPSYSEELEMVPYLDIAMNNMATLVGAKKYKEALELFSKAAAIPSPVEKTEEVNLAAERFAKAFASQPMRAAAGLIGLGVALSGTGKFSDAMEPYKMALEIEPHHPDVRLSLGSIREYMGDLQGAIEEYKKAIEVDPWAATSYQTLGLALKKTGNLRAAAEEFWKALQLDPRLASAYVNLGAVYYEAGYSSEAGEQFKKALEIEPNSADLHHKLGRLMAESGNLTEALKNYSKAVELNPSLAAAHGDLALAHEYSGNLEEALKEYRAAVRLEPNFAMLHNLLGLALKKSGKLQEAIVHYRRAIEIEPGLVNAHNNLGVALEKTGDLKQAIEQYRRVLEIDSNSAIACNNLGVALKKSGDVAGAIEQYKKAITMDPQFAAAHNNMSRALKQ
ncbi:MAG: tetratricopeptide repeat protein [Desulfomonile tiedjei]|nr:tetratricopeptide repeat protein [Desulfomonile tiedjei]